MKLPDFFYIRQTRALNNLHDFSVELLTRLYGSSNPPHAYDSEWGERQIWNLTVSIGLNKDALGEEMAARLLRRRMPGGGSSHRAEIDRDTLRMEVIQANIEYELKLLFVKQSKLIGWIACGLILAILICELVQLSLK